MKKDNMTYADIGLVISKSIFYICCVVVTSLWLSSRKLNVEIIEQCEYACGISRGIKEITSTSCECGDTIEIIENPWILPRN